VNDRNAVNDRNVVNDRIVVDDRNVAMTVVVPSVLVATATSTVMSDPSVQRQWLKNTATTYASHDVAGSVVLRTASSHASRVRIVAAVDRLQLHRSIRTSRPGRMPSAASLSERQPKTMLVAPRTVTATAMVVAAARVADPVAEFSN
jgi:hypothetical protein